MPRSSTEITVDAAGDDEQLWAFRQALATHLVVPANAFVIGEPVSVVTFDYDGNIRRGLTAKCRRTNGEEYPVAAVEVMLPAGATGNRYLAAYRKWLGVENFAVAAPARPQRQHKVAASDLHLGGSAELVVLSIKENAARCRLLKSHRFITLRASGLWDVVPGEIVVVKPRKQGRRRSTRGP